MFKKRIFLLILCISIPLISCSQNNNDVIKVKTNSYENYNEMYKNEIKYQQKYLDEEKLLFRINGTNLEIKMINYFIGGESVIVLWKTKKSLIRVQKKLIANI